MPVPPAGDGEDRRKTPDPTSSSRIGSRRGWLPVLPGFLAGVISSKQSRHELQGRFRVMGTAHPDRGRGVIAVFKRRIKTREVWRRGFDALKAWREVRPSNTFGLHRQPKKKSKRNRGTRNLGMQVGWGGGYYISFKLIKMVGVLKWLNLLIFKIFFFFL